MASDPYDQVLNTIRLLSANAAAHLTTRGQPHAEMVVRQISLAIKYWEKNGVTLDPIQREVILDSLVYTLSSVATSFEEAVTELAYTGGLVEPPDDFGHEVHGGWPGADGRNPGQ